ncbi:hypothetical protein [Phyllobacterium ifriqiyense]|uniref:hypothetical protein n=1 Tax=Phyllobacterium ifriqiyense TaxID=314238 RepID=UPI00339AAA7D
MPPTNALLSADGVQALPKKIVPKVREHCVSLRLKRVTRHVLRHSAAMELLQARLSVSQTDGSSEIHALMPCNYKP